MATVYCFTSTGNSLYAANTIADTIGGTVLPMRDGPVTCDDGVIGMVFPVFFWGLPRMVARFISKLQITNPNAYVFAVITCGGPMFGVLGMVKGLLKSKDNIRLRYGARIISVSNYLPEFEAKYTEALGQKVDQNILRVAEDVKNRKTKRVSPLSFINRLVYTFCPGEDSDKHFTVAPACKGCATCQKICPAGNITMQDGKPDFLHKCEHCLACLHHCPAAAIDWKGKKTQGKARYKNVHTSLNDLITFNRGAE